MRIPKVGEKWLRHDGGSNNIIVIDVNQGMVIGIGKPSSTKVRYRYDDGVESEKYLAEFLAKFKPEAPDVPCAVVPEPTRSELRQMAKPISFHQGQTFSAQPVMSAEQFKTYYGYDQVTEDPQKQRTGDWNDPEYRKRYTGLK